MIRFPSSSNHCCVSTLSKQSRSRRLAAAPVARCPVRRKTGIAFLNTIRRHALTDPDRPTNHRKPHTEKSTASRSSQPPHRPSHLCQPCASAARSVRPCAGRYGPLDIFSWGPCPGGWGDGWDGLIRPHGEMGHKGPAATDSMGSRLAGGRRCCGCCWRIVPLLAPVRPKRPTPSRPDQSDRFPTPQSRDAPTP